MKSLGKACYGLLYISLMAILLLGCGGGGSGEDSGGGAGVPSAPTVVAASAGNGQIYISWSAVTTASSYKLYRGTASGGISSKTTVTTVSTTGYTDTSTANGTTYYYQVTAINSYGESVGSAEVSATPQVPGSAPSAPTGVTASAGSNQVTINWSAVTDASSYKIYRGTTSGGISTKTTVATNVISATYTDTTVVNTVKYYYQITAVNSYGESSGSSEVSATPGTAPSAPTGVSATAGDGQVSISWNAVSSATSYNIYWSTSSGVTMTGGTKLSNVTSPYTHMGRTNGTTYYYVVTAINTYGESVESSQASATPTVLGPGDNWTIRDIGNSGINLYSVEWLNNQFMAVGSGYICRSTWSCGYEGIIATSSDGITWSTSSACSGDLGGIAWSGSRYVSVASYSSARINTSSDGLTWNCGSAESTYWLNDVLWSGSQFVIVGYKGTTLRSSDGLTWTGGSWAGGSGYNLSGVAWSGSKFAAVGSGGTILTSPDGATCTTRTSGTTNGLYGVTWSGSKFVAVGGTILTSLDGITWTAITSPATDVLNSVAWSGDKFVAVGDGGNVLTSP